MTERPILMSAPMVRALLAGTKTQTRRMVKATPGLIDGCHDASTVRAWVPPCPYGQHGDLLWVRETWRTMTNYDALPPRYVPTGVPLQYLADGDRPVKLAGKTRVSIHMPRWASRITLEITEVRVQRLHEISEADAEAEGCERLDSERYEPDWKLCPRCGGTRLYTAFHPVSLGALPDTDCLECDTYVKRYRYLWESINGLGTWDANPWVWAISFRRNIT